MPRLVLLTTNLAPGGAESQVFHLALELRRRGWEPSVVSLLPPSAWRPELEAEAIAVHSLGMRPGALDPRGLARLIALLNRLRPQVLHSHMFHANLLARLARLFCPVPVVISTIHSMAESARESRRIRLRDLAYRVTDPLADLVVAVCQAAAERHASAGAVRRGKLRVIPNGVDIERFHPDPERGALLRRELLPSRAGGPLPTRDRQGAVLPLADARGLVFVWLAAGRLMWKKDYPTLLRAFAKQSNAVLWIAGDGPQETELKALARDLAVAARFLGRRNDLPTLMNAADGLVLSSVVEGLPMVLLEAAASGLPAVTTDAGGAREAVADGAAGFVVPRGDPEALASAMARLAALPAEARERMSRAARAHAAGHFDLKTVAAQWERVYQELIEARAWT